MITKAELIEAIRNAGADLEAQLGRLPAEAFTRPGQENDWTGRQQLAHVASTEWTIPRLLDLAQADSSAQDAAAAFDGEAYNARQVARRADRSVEELIEEFRRNRAATIAAIDAADESLLSVEVKSAGGVHGELGRVLHYLCVEHVAGHVREIGSGA
ncbi:MAG: hypothetical protein NVSMB17_12420 [Candidatus Dormibacteria bacterium]